MRWLEVNSFVYPDRLAHMLMKVLLVFIGGGIGAITRYGVTLLAVFLLGTRFPWGTLFVNLAGCFLIGVCFSLAERGLDIMDPSTRLFFVTGYLGGLTTFSTFALETATAAREATSLVTLAYFFSNNIIGLALVFLGMWVGRLR